jgi:hypothetical protein
VDEAEGLDEPDYHHLEPQANKNDTEYDGDYFEPNATRSHRSTRH